MAEAAIGGINRYTAQGRSWNPQCHPACLDPVPQPSLSLSHLTHQHEKKQNVMVLHSAFLQKKHKERERKCSHHLCLLATSVTTDSRAMTCYCLFSWLHRMRCMCPLQLLASYRSNFTEISVHKVSKDHVIHILPPCPSPPHGSKPAEN